MLPALLSIVVLLILPGRVSFAADSRGEAKKLSAEQAAQLEAKLEAKPDDRETRLLLLHYWNSRKDSPDAATIRAGRARHILWFLKNSPKDELFRSGWSRELAIYPAGPLGDPESLKAGRAVLLEHLRNKPGDKELANNAAGWLEFEAPEIAESLYVRTGADRQLGFLYGQVLTGTTAQDFNSGEAMACDESLRESEFGKKARAALETTNNAEILKGASMALYRNGAMLYADRKSNWDYSTLLRPILARARAALPDDLMLYALSDAPPQRDERPTMTIRVGGNVMTSNLVQKVRPPYPAEAKERRIQGTARFEALVGPTGEIVHLRPVSGPAELLRASAPAVAQWRYKPTLLNGKPVFVVTLIDVRFEMR